ncbi:MAG: Hpt domain-containing protein [Pseudanabaena frigida]|uniref:Hpt domain-containing protein n=1 Tax=Pseudanabaena frigida TaxID=945775 RepID=A0A2W4WGP2_9CYAN|nr:MAG: Hpt domain-containing protein [Pseudanabaena frigida]
MDRKSNSAIDLEQLNQISEGDIEFEIEVLQVYIEDIMQRIDKIRGEFSSNDLAQVLREAHHIKGASSNVGALQMQALAEQIEKLDLNCDSEKILTILNDMLEKMKDIELFVAEKMAGFSS